jgi:F-type H+-transporting ATPase subunit beta
MPTATKTGIIQQIIGVVVDLEFTDHIPALYNALTIERAEGGSLVLEVSQHLSGNVVRAIALGTTDGLQRGQEATDKKLWAACLM